jgi:hypothetical protein
MEAKKMAPKLIAVAEALTESMHENQEMTMSYLAYALGASIGAYSNSIDTLLEGIKIGSDAIRSSATDTYTEFEKHRRAK